jgi:hypothetical protein
MGAEKSGQEPKNIRTTLVLPHTLDRNLEAWCLVEGITKSEVVRLALTEFLTQQGLRPDEKPTITYR